MYMTGLESLYLVTQLLAAIEEIGKIAKPSLGHALIFLGLNWLQL